MEQMRAASLAGRLFMAPCHLHRLTFPHRAVFRHSASPQNVSAPSGCQGAQCAGACLYNHAEGRYSHALPSWTAGHVDQKDHELLSSITRAQERVCAAVAASMGPVEPRTASEASGKAMNGLAHETNALARFQVGGQQGGPAGSARYVASPGEGCGQRGLEAAPFLQLAAYLDCVRKNVLAVQETAWQLRSKLEAAIGSMQAIVSNRKVVNKDPNALP